MLPTVTSATVALDAVLQGLGSKTSVHWSQQATYLQGGSVSKTFKTTVSAGVTSGSQSLTWTDGTASGSATIVLLHDHCYVKADPLIWTSLLGYLSASAAAAVAGKWVSFVPSDGTAYFHLQDGLTIQSMDSVLAIDPTAFHLSGSPPSSRLTVTGAVPGDSSSQATLTADQAGGRYLASSYSVATAGSDGGTDEILLSDYGAPVSVTAPSDATAYSAIAGGSSSS